MTKQLQKLADELFQQRKNYMELYELDPNSFWLGKAEQAGDTYKKIMEIMWEKAEYSIGEDALFPPAAW